MASRILLLLLVPVPAPAEVVVVASSTSEPITVAAAAPPRRHVPRLRRGVRVGAPRFLSTVRVARTQSLPARSGRASCSYAVAPGGAAANRLCTCIATFCRTPGQQLLLYASGGPVQKLGELAGCNTLASPAKIDSYACRRRPSPASSTQTSFRIRRRRRRFRCACGAPPTTTYPSCPSSLGRRRRCPAQRTAPAKWPPSSTPATPSRA